MSSADADAADADRLTTGAARSGPIRLDARRYDHDDVQTLVQSLYAEQFGLYGFADSPDTQVVSDYVEPQGLFLVGYTPSGEPVGCGGCRTYDRDKGLVEVRKMYILPDHRGQGLGWMILDHLEQHAAAHGARGTLLETGSLNRAAVRLYSGAGYRPVPSYVSGRSELNRAFVKSLNPAT
ncbi:GNAT family N-acetyltransferase [Kribbella sp. NPDC058245]|uniref:GNAT family N-acetyltransferase n=1 Tax=Kribbella sp. NPDC058245 TaxID=3346399 RepID=UPI0036ECEF1C